ncbi:tyrosine-type recombinase/integrase [Kitasatospora sp. NPDC091207]|uniref:tyrosine-type recombinase/integrase n=1 Tax=Kitasatospora sp. NPDC091207 TaxID=3364083 RepID=UPI0038241635
MGRGGGGQHLPSPPVDQGRGRRGHHLCGPDRHERAQATEGTAAGGKGRSWSGPTWNDHDLVFARDGFKLFKAGRAGGPQDPEKVSARWRTLRNRLGLPEDFRVHDLRHSHVTNALEAGENPVEVSANVRHHSPGYTMARYGHSRKDGARKLAASNASRVGLSALV